MIHDIQWKVCGLTSTLDAQAAVKAGADYLGFIFYPPSPRNVTLEQFRALKAVRPGRTVAVCVSPTVEDLGTLAQAGADFFQVHFPAETPFKILRAWSEAVGSARLWLAPRLPAALDVPPGWLPLADTILLDTFDPVKFGGTGHTGDWKKFARHQGAHPTKTWILSGGLNAANVADALTQSGAKFVDANSGVESIPGIKAAAKLAAFAAAIRTVAALRARAAGA